MSKLTIAKIAAATVGAVLVSGAVVAVTAFAAGVPVGPLAASPSPKPSGSPSASGDRAQYCQDFVNHFASDLGKKPSDVQTAAQKALGQTLDDAVKAGKLTQAQADQIKQKAANHQLCAGLDGIGRAGAAGHPGAKIAVESLLADTAKALGISEDDLKAQLKAGKSVKDIATSKGMSEQQFRDALVAAVKADLDAKVKAGTITQAQEDAALDHVRNGPLPYWDKVPQRPNKPSASPSASPGSTS
jgi:hypothetical protein